MAGLPEAGAVLGATTYGASSIPFSTVRVMVEAPLGTASSFATTALG